MYFGKTRVINTSPARGNGNLNITLILSLLYSLSIDVIAATSSDAGKQLADVTKRPSQSTDVYDIFFSICG